MIPLVKAVEALGRLAPKSERYNQFKLFQHSAAEFSRCCTV